MVKKTYDKYDQDANYKFLHDQILALLVQFLKSDMEFLKSSEIKGISLAAKWCPSIDSSYDKAILICKNIVERICLHESSLEYEGLNEDQYVYKVRNRLRKEVPMPLRQVLKSPEVYMSAQQWESIPLQSRQQRI
ncbi:Uncharacterized conserved protein UCP015417 [Abeliophyllum distichum]|uniref:Uncharacterized conserved protein UCP015417 n=1 Tax=Abeliophyllum distichum TaxID=126358 RepID=A0ABD1T1M1_9LAMI